MTASSEFAAFVGIDWADEAHAVCLLTADGKQLEHDRVAQQPEALDAWVTQLRNRFVGRPIAICLEQSRGALVYALMKYDGLVLFPINPKQLSCYRDAMSPSGAKDDPTDAELLGSFVREHHQRLRAWQPDDVTTRRLRLLSEQRRRWVDQRTALGNQLLQTLKECYPLALHFLGCSVYGEHFVTLLSKFPSQPELQRASPKQLERYLPKKRRVADDPPAEMLHAQRVAWIRQAMLLVTDRAVLDSGRLAVRHLIAVLKQLNRTIADYDQQLSLCLAEHPDASLFAALPGAGAALTPRLIVAFGSDRQRYASATELQQWSGVAPVTKRSGKSSVVLMRRACPKFLRQTFHEFARCSIARSAWSAAYCAMLRAKGHGYHSAVRALAFKWIRILFRCWQLRQPYDEGRYIDQLRRKNSPLLAYLKPVKATPSP